MKPPLLFRLTGALGDGLEAADGTLVPAAFARRRDLACLRYRFPLVLDSRMDGEVARPLSAIVDEALESVAPAGPTGDRVRRTAVRAEREIRSLGDGIDRDLAAAWDAASERLVLRGGAQARADLDLVRDALLASGELLDCDARMPARFIAHVWRIVHSRRAAGMRAVIDPLVARLSDQVRADFLRSPAGQRADVIGAGLGPFHRELFDLDLMAHLLATPAGTPGMSERRRRRIEAALADLRATTLFDPDRAPVTLWSIDAALESHRAALPRLAAVARAIAIAELEVAGRYAEDKHGPLALFDADDLGPEELSWSPDRLVVLRPGADGVARRASVFGALASGCPLKVVVETDEVLGPDSRLASAAIGLGDTFVVQVSASELPRVTDALVRALEFRGPALICVFTGAVRDDLQPYLVAAAATDSRAFPTFNYDPSAGEGWARRFTLGHHAQRERDVPVDRFTYADESLQRHAIDVAVTPVDLALCDPRWATSFAAVPRESWPDLVPVADVLGDGAMPAAAPAIYAVDADDRVRMVAVGERLLHAARASLDEWRRLRELDDLKSERVAPVTVAVEPAPAAPPSPAVIPESAAAEPAGDAPYIETARCSSCNECTLLNPRMFKYNENKQAYIADPAAGTYRELVEAAESCQVAIIHPGKPRDLSEAGLNELVERAAAFA